MKKVFVPILLALMFVTAVSLAESAFLDAAMALLPKGAGLVETDRDDGLYEYEFRDGNARYDVIMNASGQPLVLKTDWPQVWAAETDALDAETACAQALAAIADKAPDAQAVLAFPERDNRKWVWKVFARSNADLFEVEMNAQSGNLKESEQYYGAVEQTISPDVFRELLEIDKGITELTGLDLEYDDGVLIYTGTAAAGTAYYEFEALARDGTLIEWERD